LIAAAQAMHAYIHTCMHTHTHTLLIAAAQA
jgi:hypothetical protein